MKYKINKGFITHKSGTDLVIFDAETSSMFTLNTTATFLFNQLKKGSQKTELAGKLTEHYNIPISQASRDVGKLLDRLTKNNIIQILK